MSVHAIAVEPGQSQGIEQRELLSLSLKKQEPKGHGAFLSTDTQYCVLLLAGALHMSIFAETSSGALSRCGAKDR
jgi:hypothetical protein